MRHRRDLLEPLLGTEVPRFSGPASFMRLPTITDPATLDIALVGIPFDGGCTTRPGARLGPREVRNVSCMMRRIHPTTGLCPYELCAVGDVGDVPVNPVDLTGTLGSIENFFSELHRSGTTALGVGGDHLVSLPIIRAIARDRSIGMVHFDAHSDTGDTYFGGSTLEHGTPFRRAIEEGLLDPRRIVQIGIRGSLYLRDDLDWARAQGIRIVTIEEVYERGIDNVMAEARAIVGVRPTYLSFDIDSIDPAFAPGTGTPEVGGFTTFEAFRMLRHLRGLDLIGADLVEVSPPFDVGAITALAAASLMFEILCLLAEARTSRSGCDEGEAARPLEAQT